MTDEQIKECVIEIFGAVTESWPGTGKTRELAIELLDYRRARDLLVAKGYNSAWHWSRGMPNEPLAELVQLLSDKVEKPDEAEEPSGRCGDCEYWAALEGAKLPAYLVEWDVGIGVCMDSKAMKLKTSRMHCDHFTARK